MKLLFPAIVAILLSVNHVTGQTTPKPTAAPTAAPKTTPAQTTQTPAPGTHPTTVDPTKAYSCPTPVELGNVPGSKPQCSCYPSLFYIVCTNIAKPFALVRTHHVKELVIRNTATLPLIDGHSDPANRLLVDTLIIVQEETSPSKLPTMDNLEALFALSTNSFKISSKDSLTAGEPLDVSALPDALHSITITNVHALEGFDFQKFTNLQQLVLKDISFTEPIIDVPLLFSPDLKSLELSNIKNLTGSVFFQPTICLSSEKIHIKLTNNPQLTSFDFSALFPVNQTCKYHIELSNNGFTPDYLESQAEAIEKANSESLYLILRSSTEFSCNCAVFKAYEKHVNYIHGAKCKTDKNVEKFIDELKKEDLNNCT